jgi:hypothetical protein
MLDREDLAYRLSTTEQMSPATTIGGGDEPQLCHGSGMKATGFQKMV